MYCGNNALFPGLTTGTHFIGTNYQCLKKGIGVGSNLPYDPQYAVPYAPIDGRRFYCGTNHIVPPTHTAIGSTSKCLATGVGIGKARKAALGPPNIFYQRILLYILFFIVLIVVFCIFYFKKPKFLIKKDLNIDWEKFWLYYTVICLITYIFINILSYISY